MKAVQLIIIVSFLMASSCSTDHASKESMANQSSPDMGMISEEMEQEPPRMKQPSSTDNTKTEIKSKIIKNGHMNFEVDDLEQAKVAVNELVEKYEGYFENESYHAYGNRKNYSLSIRIPNAQFESLVNGLEGGIGRLTNKNISARDVTEEYLDLELRLENNLAYLGQYKEILKKAKSIEEILKVQEKIRRIEEEIESKKGRLKYLSSKVSFSTLSVELSELLATGLSNKPNFFKRLGNAFSYGIQGFQHFLIALVSLWPFILIIGLMIFFRKRLFGWIRRNR